MKISFRIVHMGLELERDPDWICVTSKHAIRSLEVDRDRFKGIPCATVGQNCANQLRNIGMLVEIAGARTAVELARTLLARTNDKTLVLWPRGSLSDELGEILRTAGLEVCAPIVYETTERPGTGPLPSAEAIFFASPSPDRARTSLLSQIPVCSILNITSSSSPTSGRHSPTRVVIRRSASLGCFGPRTGLRMPGRAAVTKARE